MEVSGRYERKPSVFKANIEESVKRLQQALRKIVKSPALAGCDSAKYLSEEV